MYDGAIGEVLIDFYTRPSKRSGNCAVCAEPGRRAGESAAMNGSLAAGRPLSARWADTSENSWWMS